MDCIVSQAVRSLSASGMKGSQSSGLLSRLRVAFSDSGKGRTDSAGIYFRRDAYWFEWTEAPTCLYQGQFPRGAPSFAPIAERFHSRRSKSESNIAKCVVCQQTMDKWDSTNAPIYKLIHRPEDA